MTLADFVSRLSPVPEITLVDVGSVGGPKRRWEVLSDHMRTIEFDPRTKSIHEDQEHRRVVHPIAVAKEQGVAELFVTKFGNMSSLLKPNHNALSSYQRWGDEAEIVQTDSLSVDKLDNILKGQSADAIKVDVQGGEIDVLVGAEAFLRGSGVLVAEIEVSFFERYVGQPLFGDICSFMVGRGFDFIDLFQRRRYYRKNASGIGHIVAYRKSVSGRLSYADAIFFVSDEELGVRMESLDREQQAAMIEKAILCFSIYGKVDHAASLYDLWGARLNDERRKVTEDFFSKLGK